MTDYNYYEEHKKENHVNEYKPTKYTRIGPMLPPNF